MSSFGGQWRVIRHYLSLSNLNTEVEKLVQKVKPATAEQWESLIQRFEKAITLRLSQSIESPALEAKTKTQEQIKVELKDEAKDETKDKTKDQEGLTVGSEAKEITIEGFLQGLKLKKDLHFGKISEQSWKSNKPIITKSSIHSRTAYVISAIVAAETTECLKSRTEHLIDHLIQYPEARDYAIKEGAIRALLRVQRRLGDDAEELTKEVAGIVREALALMGYTGPTKGPGPNILSIDGGGIRGLIAIEILRHLEKLTGRKVNEMFDYIIGVSTGAIIAAVIGGLIAIEILRHLEKLTGRKVNEMFDYIIGVSTGAIIAAVIGSGVGNLETANQMYMTLSKKMFGNTSVIGGTSRLVWSHSYYDTEAWEALLKDNLNDRTLTECNRHNNPKMALVSCVVNAGSRLTPFLFRSYECGFRVRSVFPGTSRAKVWHAVRASAAAPTYFNEFHLNGLLHQDGGIMVNNPTGVGIHEAKLLFGPNSIKNGTVISVGTGQALNKHMDYQLISKSLKENNNAPGTSWKDKFNKILDSATDTESTHLMLNDLLPPGTYFRFNPPLMQECAMDEIDPQKLNNLIIDTHSYIRRNQHKFEQAARMIVRKRTIPQRIMDFVDYQSQIMGVVNTK
ncbi:patatin-like phospholipase domain-containing protein [Phthorimaea operculella]|nr:patatin-like phospholipase domain-containing protein [Phthorimaea operculella]